MQTLWVNTKNEKGEEIQKKVVVLRSWHDASGAAIYLHSEGGIYGYMDGSPIRSQKELDIIDNKNQYAVAMRWWESRGRELSEAFYAARDAAEKARLGDFREKEAAETELDYVLYESRATGSKGKWSAPFAWVEKFASRPDWWGQADSIGFADTEYRKAEASAPPEKPGTVKAGEV